MPEFRARVLVAEDEEFTLSLLKDVLTNANFEVNAVSTVADAIEQVVAFDPHVVISDLNFGVSGPSGAELMQYVSTEHPWIGKVVLTSHASPGLAIPSGLSLPEDVIYLVKTKLSSIAELVAAVEDSISSVDITAIEPVIVEDQIVISSAQGEILLLIAEGLTNAAIAKRRGTTLRTTETLVQRTFAALGLKNDEDINPRVMAVRLWQQGKVSIK